MKNLLFIDHIYHKKTKSSDFFIEILQSEYCVDVIYYDPYQEMDFISDNPIKAKYDVLILWQIIVDRNQIDSLCSYEAGIIIPMYDDYITNLHGKWYQFLDFKALCFSNALYDSMISRGFDAKYVQYFIKPVDDIKYGSVNSLFFWQRISTLNCRLIEKLVENTCINHIHIHRSLDPNNVADEINQQNFSLSYSEWFDNESDMLECMNESAVYIAPRYYEGIGMSFLKAMAHGRCVIAPDNPTMNEYITNGYNGVLWKDGDTVLLNADTIRQIQKNTLEYMTKGYKSWIDSIDEIIKWISDGVQLSSDNINNQREYLCLELNYQTTLSQKHEKYFNCLYYINMYNGNDFLLSEYLIHSGYKHIAL